MPDPAYLPAWIAARVGRHDGPALTWGEPCATPAEALRAARGEVDLGQASVGFVVRVHPGGRREPMADMVWPRPARRVVGHWLELLAACAAERSV